MSVSRICCRRKRDKLVGEYISGQKAKKGASKGGRVLFIARDGGPRLYRRVSLSRHTSVARLTPKCSNSYKFNITPVLRDNSVRSKNTIIDSEIISRICLVALIQCRSIS